MAIFRCSLTYSITFVTFVPAFHTKLTIYEHFWLCNLADFINFILRNSQQNFKCENKTVFILFNNADYVMRKIRKYRKIAINTEFWYKANNF